MNQKIAMKIMDGIDNLFETIPDEQLSTWNFLVQVNDLVAKYEGIDCLMHLNFANGKIIQAMCIITDWTPGLLVLQSDNGDLPYMRLIYPEETASFMNEVMPLFEAEYPPIPDEDKE